MAFKKLAKSVKIGDREAVELINKRAVAENRTSANAAAQTIIEALRPKYSQVNEKDNTQEH